MRLFVSAGEASGDAYGAAIARAVSTLVPAVQIEAMGGPELKSAGATIVADSSQNAAIGVVRSIGIALRVFAATLATLRRLKTGEPGIFVPIDYGFVNTKLAARARKRGWKVLYFIPPGSWRRDRQGKDLPLITDAVVTPFEWSADILRKMGANAFWFGHPIKSLMRGMHSGHREGIAVLPGSRPQEIESNLPPIAGSLAGKGRVEFAVASTIGKGKLTQAWAEVASGRSADVFTERDVAGVLARARCAIVCSGTATLQAAVLKCPMVVIYGLSPLLKLEARLLRLDKKLKFVSLPNIFLNRMAVPELLGDGLTAEALQSWVEKLESDSPERAAQLQAFDELDAMLGPEDCIEKTAELIVKLALPDKH